VDDRDQSVDVGIAMVLEPVAAHEEFEPAGLLRAA
jgi:hypothetical protein